MSLVILPPEENKLFFIAECHAIEKARYIDSEREKRDLRFDKDGNINNEHPADWIRNHAFNFRISWPTSCCRTCKLVVECYDCLKGQCDKYKKRT